MGFVWNLTVLKNIFIFMWLFYMHFIFISSILITTFVSSSFFIKWGFKTKQKILGDFLKKLTYCNYVQIIFKWTCYMPWHSKKIFLWLPFKSMTYETKENTFVFTIWRKKVLLTDIFYCSVFFSPIEKKWNFKSFNGHNSSNF